MNFLNTRLVALDAWFARRTAFLSHPRAASIVLVLVPLLCGLVSMMSGQDDGWDMRNYHLYNAHALLNGRIGFDLSPAGFQSYFNPTLELPYHYLNRWLPPRLAGFVMGTLHGLSFVLLAGIARRLIGAGDGQRQRVALLLAMACMFGPGFLSELGNTMGDNLTALPVLASLYIVLRCWDGLLHWNVRAVMAALGSGLAMGVATGLKLTNAPYAVALCLALLAVPLPWWQRLRVAFVFGVGVLVGIAVSAGWWFLKMWNEFGNPLFPQFNNLFHSPLAPETGVIDVSFRPLNLLENVLWPFLFALKPRRVSELPMKLAVWPVLYVLLALFVVIWLVRIVRRREGEPRVLPKMDARGVVVLIFVAVAYLIWMRLFSIYRYLIPLELLAPLVIWIVWQAVAPSLQRVAGFLLALLAVCVFPIANWGHAEWGDRAISAQVPAFAAPSNSIVFFAQSNPPSGWMATFFPPEVKIIALGTGLAEPEAWRRRQQAAIAERGGPHYLLFTASRNDKDGTRLRKLAAAQWLGLTDDAAGCGKLAWIMKRVRLQAELRNLPTGGCTLDLLPEHRLDLAAMDRELIAQLAQRVRQYGLQLDAASCNIYPAAVGKEPYPYQLCRVTPQPGE
jgi:hypothetical protein